MKKVIKLAVIAALVVWIVTPLKAQMGDELETDVQYEYSREVYKGWVDVKWTGTALTYGYKIKVPDMEDWRFVHNYDASLAPVSAEKLKDSSKFYGRTDLRVALGVHIISPWR